MVSIVIPAHNEAAVIGPNLRRLLAGTQPGEFDVIVVPNACRDRTAELAAEVPGVRVIETSIPGKVPALRLGDEACKSFPRVYLDADVELTADSVRALVAACARPGVLAAAPVPELDLAQVGRLVRRVHRVHDRMIAPSRALAGVGVYVLTEAGHARVFPMPDVIADDGWVHTSFAPHERAIVAEARSVVRPARTVQAHLNRRVRVRRGNRQLAALDRAHAGGPGLGSLAGLVRRREVSPIDAAAYLSVLVLDRAVSRVRRDKASWGSDLSTRAAAPAE
ncbi:glycosyltransferase [Dactylosporangium sp. CS-033363]|uniref:glycosyltransferase n=1 Tax=Dactylosporangium sp. CS-033363 TaxID=3239935 RepID=UPI003D8C5B7E